MNGPEAVLREFERWDQDLARLEGEFTAGDWAQRERLMVTSQRTGPVLMSTAASSRAGAAVVRREST